MNFVKAINTMRWLTAGGIALLCAVFVSGCNDGDKTPVDDEVSLRFVGRVLVVKSEMIILKENNADVGKKFIIAPPPGVKNRFILERLPLKSGARLKIARWDHRRHWSGKTGVVPIVQLLGDERLAGVEMELRFALSFDTARNKLYVDPFYLRLLPEPEQPSQRVPEPKTDVWPSRGRHVLTFDEPRTRRDSTCMTVNRLIRMRFFGASSAHDELR